MGFFDDLVLPEQPARPREELLRQGPPGADAGRDRPPVDWFEPVLVSQLAVAGAGPTAKVVVRGWSVWPRSVTLHLSVRRPVYGGGDEAGRQSGLRVGLLLADGRRMTSLDASRGGSLVGPAAIRAACAGPEESSGLIPLDPGLGHVRRSVFKTDVDLYLPELPPPGETRLVVEWPDEGIPETSTPVDAGALRAAAARALEAWPDLPVPDPAAQPESLAMIHMSGPPPFLAPPLTRHQRAELRREEEARQRYVPRADWSGIGYRDWGDAELIRARLSGGAPPDALAHGDGTPLHRAAECGGAEAVAALLPHVTRVDAVDGQGRTALWHAVCATDERSVRLLIDAGADVWTPQCGPWSPGRLLLTTPLAPLVAGLPGAVALPSDEAAAFRAADDLIGAFDKGDVWTEGLGIAFVRDLDEDEVIRRLGGDPARCPQVGPEETPFDDEHRAGRDDADDDVELTFVRVTALPGSPGGCVVTQQAYMPADADVLRAISAGTAAYGVYFNPKGGTHGTLARDGEIVRHEEIGLTPDEADAPAHWHFRFWQHGDHAPYGARDLAYACGAAGLHTGDGSAALDHDTPQRWVELAPELRR
ncbi:ankyrin repeat domain-containing protein [Streptomyces sp. NPDC052114]|uniref:ankyrin repeat domain-containing protein n=1 Tax=unclassified Streptomyces TaxID=2593676 RepID=UPI00342F49BC